MADREFERNLTEWVRRARQGDIAAFGSLVEATETMVSGVVRSILGSSPDLSDAVQETCLGAFKKLGELRDDAAFPGWLRRIAIVSAYDVRRRRRGTFLQIDNEPVVPVLDDAETRWSPSQRSALAAALLHLSPEERKICSRHYHWGWSIARLAADAGVTESTMKKRLQRVRDRLRRDIERGERMQSEHVLPPGELPAKIVELLSRPSLIDVPENPVGHILEKLCAEFAGFTQLEAPEVVDLPKALAAMRFDPVYVDRQAVHQIDSDKILRYDLSLPLLLTARVEKQPLRLWSAGKVYRKDLVSSMRLEAFHQFEILDVEDAARFDSWTFAARILRSIDAILPKSTVQITPTEYPMCTKAWELSVEVAGIWSEVMAWGIYIPRVVEFLGGDPATQVAAGAGYGLERIAGIAFGIDDIRRIEFASVPGT